MDKRILYIWWVELFLAAFVLCAVTSLVFRLFGMWWYLLMGLWLIIFSFFFSFYLPKRYKRFAYALTSTHFVIRSGVFYDKITYLKLSNVQFVTKVRSIMDYFFKLNSVHIRTAGGLDIVYGLRVGEADELAEVLAGLAGEESP